MACVQSQKPSFHYLHDASVLRPITSFDYHFTLHVCASGLRHWVYDPAADPHIKLLIRDFQLERPVQRRIMPKWDLHLVLMALMIRQPTRTSSYSSELFGWNVQCNAESCPSGTFILCLWHWWVRRSLRRSVIKQIPPMTFHLNGEPWKQCSY